MLTGTGLAASSGLNAWVPLLALGLLARYTNLVTLPQDWSWLTNGWVLGVLVALLVLELVADKVPVLDSINDIVYTVVRPTTAGRVRAGSTTVTTTDAGTGRLLDPDRGRSGARADRSPAQPWSTGPNADGVGAFVSTAEDFTSVYVPGGDPAAGAGGVLPVGLGLFFWWALRRRASAPGAGAAPGQS